VPDAELLEAIASGESLQSLRTRLAEGGFQTLREDGWEKVAAGLTTPEEVLYAASQG
jgi:type II secretory ATPase GspE/PulE/Tfp pilus assembly ATPase PilB-like protein